MLKIWNRPVTWLALFVSDIGALLMAIFGIHMYKGNISNPDGIMMPDPRHFAKTTGNFI